jgi:DNA-binding CsgD family transcriptional regulator
MDADAGVLAPVGAGSVVTQTHPSPDLVRCGAELVELSERFYRAVFLGGLVFIGLASIAALALLPVRQSVPSGGPPPTVIATALLIVAMPLCVWRAGALYRRLLRWPALELSLVAVAAALVVYPLNSELWWPSCAIIMLLAAVVPLRRTVAYCLIVLVANLAAHIVSGDLDHTPAVSIIGLWIGYPFWAATFALITDRLVAHILRVNAARPAQPEWPVRVSVWVDEASPHASGTAPPSGFDSPLDGARGSEAIDPDAYGAHKTERVLERLTARQLQVVALLADGLRYIEVAACLSISVRQVERHVADAIDRAGVRSANELVAVAVTEGLVPNRSGTDDDEHVTRTDAGAEAIRP